MASWEEFMVISVYCILKFPRGLKNGRENIQDNPYPGYPSSSKPDENIQNTVILLGVFDKT